MKTSNQQGSIHFPLLFLTLGIMMISITLLLNSQRKLETVRIHSQHHLCLKFGMEAVKKYAKEIGQINKQIRALFYASNTVGLALPPVGAGGRKVIRALEVYQFYKYTQVVSILARNPYCGFSQNLQIYATLPYSFFRPMSGQKLRNFDRTLTTGKKQEWRSVFMTIKMDNGLPPRRHYLHTPLKITQKDHFSPPVFKREKIISSHFTGRL